MQATRNARIKSLQTMRNVITEKSSPTTATSSGQDIQAHVCQSDGHITATIRPEYEANVGPTKAVQPPPRPIRRPCTPPPRPARHLMIPTATEGFDESAGAGRDDSRTEASEDASGGNDKSLFARLAVPFLIVFSPKETDHAPVPYELEWFPARGC